VVHFGSDADPSQYGVWELRSPHYYDVGRQLSVKKSSNGPKVELPEGDRWFLMKAVWPEGDVTYIFHVRT
jgi:hypothetical protein